VNSREIAWMKRQVEVTAHVAGARTRTVPSRRAFRYLAWVSRSIPALIVAVGWEADGGEPQTPRSAKPISQTRRQLPAGHWDNQDRSCDGTCWNVSERDADVSTFIGPDEGGEGALLPRARGCRIFEWSIANQGQGKTQSSTIIHSGFTGPAV
jgi:hypothetical protein